MAEYGFNTTLLHGVDDKNPFGTTQVPIYQSSAFRHECAEDLEKIFTNKAMGFSYTRINNPTVEAFGITIRYVTENTPDAYEALITVNYPGLSKNPY